MCKSIEHESSKKINRGVIYNVLLAAAALMNHMFRILSVTPACSMAGQANLR